LASLPLAGATVTFDAEFTQWLVAKQVFDQGGAYLMVVKAGQPSLFRACVEATAEQPKRPRRPLGQAHTHQLAHGRLEQRSLSAVAAPPDLGFRMRTRCCVCNDGFVSKRTGEVLTAETAYAVTSLTAKHATPRQLLRLSQRHWWIENREHWRATRTSVNMPTPHAGSAPQAFAAFCNLALSLLHRWRHRTLTAARVLRQPSRALFNRLQLTPAGQ
jgi:hypothetical protein